MRRLFLVVLLLALAGTAGAIDIKGKWGLGVGTGSGTWSLTRAEVSLIRGKSEKSALILDLSVLENYGVLTGGATGGLTERHNDFGFGAGPRFRRFTRSNSNFSPYYDWYIHATGYSYHSEYFDEASGYHSTNNSTKIGGELGFDIGVEYFTPWHFSLAAHSGFLNLGASRVWERGHGQNSREKGYSTTLGLGPSPNLKLRVYF
jgi:hypothetical protein